jgi:phospholipid-binding lipoprotein MlaA
MPTVWAARAALAIVCMLSVGGCVTLPPNSKRTPQDPWESWNRGVYKVNDKLDRAIAKPVARAYVRVVPQPIRTGVSNFFDNLTTPTVMINDALQGKILAAGNDLGRFLFNSTVGLGGLLDPATAAGMAKNNEDFGQTLGRWGVHPGPFVELPVLGPSDVRDAPSRLVDAYTNPQAYIHNGYVKWGLYTVSLVDSRMRLLSLEETIQNAYDPYAFIRDAYLQRRAYLVADGKIKDEQLEDPGADNPDSDHQDAPAKPSTGAPPTGPQPATPPPPPQPATPVTPVTPPAGG